MKLKQRIFCEHLWPVSRTVFLAAIFRDEIHMQTFSFHFAFGIQWRVPSKLEKLVRSFAIFLSKNEQQFYFFGD
jgi:hypothetical protein